MYYLCEYVFMFINIYVQIILKTCDKISSIDTSSKQLYMTCGYITIKYKKKYSQWWVVEYDQFCWGANVKMTVLKYLKQFLWSSTDEPYYFNHYIQSVSFSSASKCLITCFNFYFCFTFYQRNKLYMHWLVFFSGISN